MSGVVSFGEDYEDIWMIANWGFRKLFSDIQDKFPIGSDIQYTFEKAIAFGCLDFDGLVEKDTTEILHMMRATIIELIDDDAGLYRKGLDEVGYRMYRGALPELLSCIEKYESKRGIFVGKSSEVSGNALFSETPFFVLDTDRQNNRVLVMAKDIVAEAPYHEIGGGVTWERCTLRKILNTTYYESLPQDKKNQILEVTLKNPNNEGHNTAGGNDTRDKVFLLSIDEARRYFTDNESRIAKFQGKSAWWWLRSPGYFSDLAAYVLIDGVVLVNGVHVTHRHVGVRPAFWLNLNS